jgi:hypothetical protein
MIYSLLIIIIVDFPAREAPTRVEFPVQSSIKYPSKQCCGSEMFIPDPDFYPSRIPDPKTAAKERGE